MDEQVEKKILVVEDEVPMARAIQDNLKAAGFEVSVARNGQEGLERVAEETFDVVLLDIAMPNVDGMEMMQRMREASPEERVPIIIYTNMIPDAEILEGVSRDKPTYYLSKTEHSIQEVIEKIQETVA